jgi:hypothetical protein
MCRILPTASSCSVRARPARAGERADIDIGMEGPASVSSPALAAIHDELDEAPTPYTIEVVDFARVSQKFRRVAEHRIAL